jgi:hypothetical protein
MEVHHHPDLHHRNKHWKEYFLEFLMIFLAVTMGFFAENIRERISERGKEKEFIESMVADLKSDTANFRYYILNGTAVTQKIDSLINMLRSQGKDTQTATLYYLARTISTKSYPVQMFDRTYSQMKSSGNLRILHVQSIADSVTAYYYDAGLITSQQNFINNFLLEYIKNVSVVFDAAVFQKMYNHGLTMDSSANARFQYLIMPPDGNPALSDESKPAINALIGSIHFLYARVINMNTIISYENKKAALLIHLLQKEYHLENE